MGRAYKKEVCSACKLDIPKDPQSLYLHVVNSHAKLAFEIVHSIKTRLTLLKIGKQNHQFCYSHGWHPPKPYDHAAFLQHFLIMSFFPLSFGQHVKNNPERFDETFIGDAPWHPPSAFHKKLFRN